MNDVNRIRYLRGCTYVENDKKIFELYRQGVISAHEGAHKMGRNNDTTITEETFISNANKLGYRRKK